MPPQRGPLPFGHVIPVHRPVLHRLDPGGLAAKLGGPLAAEPPEGLGEVGVHAAEVVEVAEEEVMVVAGAAEREQVARVQLQLGATDEMADMEGNDVMDFEVVGDGFGRAGGATRVLGNERRADAGPVGMTMEGEGRGDAAPVIGGHYLSDFLPAGFASGVAPGSAGADSFFRTRRPK